MKYGEDNGKNFMTDMPNGGQSDEEWEKLQKLLPDRKTRTTVVSQFAPDSKWDKMDVEKRQYMASFADCFW